MKIICVLHLAINWLYVTVYMSVSIKDTLGP